MADDVAPSPLNFILLFVLCSFVEDVIGQVGHEYPLANVCDLATFGTSGGI
jgi:hypothetical protein